MQFNFIYDPSVANAPSGFEPALNAAAQVLDHLITNNITVNIEVGWGEMPPSDTPLTGDASEGGPSSTGPLLNYNQVTQYLAQAAQTPTAIAAYNDLPNSYTINNGPNGQFFLSDAQEKAFGILSPTGTEIDGYVGFSSTAPYNFSTTPTAVAGEISFLGIAEHELAHALGRQSGIEAGFGYSTILDLYRYTAPGVLQSAPGQAAYFSINDGQTNLDSFATSGDTSDWSGANGPDAFNYLEETGVVNPITAADITEMNVLGFQVACFATGTRIRTTRGEIAVEALRPGEDHAITAAGAARRIIWVGRRTIVPTRHARPAEVLPVRVRRDAVAPGLPARDLLLSPDHALFLGGVLIPVRYLVNGRTVAQEPAATITYWHVELDSHDVLLAEGLPAESYLDTGNRGAFAGQDQPMTLHPAFARAVWQRHGCAKLVLRGARLVQARRKLLRQAARLGHAMTEDADLCVLADGRRLAAQAAGPHWSVMVPAGTRALRLVSRRWVPAEMRAEDRDTRRLGVAVAGLRINGLAVALDSPALGTGWHAPEPSLRWTDGDAALAADGVRHLAFDLATGGTYWAPPAAVAARRRACA
jgi:hypothetical protein